MRTANSELQRQHERHDSETDAVSLQLNQARVEVAELHHQLDRQREQLDQFESTTLELQACRQQLAASLPAASTARLQTEKDDLSTKLEALQAEMSALTEKHASALQQAAQQPANQHDNSARDQDLIQSRFQTFARGASRILQLVENALPIETSDESESSSGDAAPSQAVPRRPAATSSTAPPSQSTAAATVSNPTPAELELKQTLQRISEHVTLYAREQAAAPRSTLAVHAMQPPPSAQDVMQRLASARQPPEWAAGITRQALQGSIDPAEEQLVGCTFRCPCLQPG